MLNSLFSEIILYANKAELIEAELIERISHLPENLKMISNPALDE